MSREAKWVAQEVDTRSEQGPLSLCLLLFQTVAKGDRLGEDSDWR